MGSLDNIAKIQSDQVINEVLEKIEILEKQDEKDFVVKKEELIAMLDDMLEKSESKRRKARENTKAIIRRLSPFWKMGYTVYLDEQMLLRRPLNIDKDSFLVLQKENSFVPYMFKEKSFVDRLWEEHLAENAIMCSIINMKTNEYVGYCGIKDTTKEKWEIAVEILQGWQRQGWGIMAVSRMLDTIVHRSGVNEFRVRIDTDNYASQSLFEKIGAESNGISEFLLHDEEMIRKCEEKNQSRIDDRLRAVAQKFGVEPKSLLSHVLEYKLIWNV